MKYTFAAVAVLAAFSFTSEAQADLKSQPTSSSPMMDGVVAPGEWNTAGYELDGAGLAGATYAMWQNGLSYDSGAITYTGTFSFLLHNIEQNTTFDNNGSPAYNVFDIFQSGDPNNVFLEVKARYDGFEVKNFETGQIRTFAYDGTNAPEQTADYDWDYYWGIYARGGYGNSAFTSKLPATIDNDNQLFEVAYRNTDDIGAAVRRSIKDPDQKQNWKEVVYLDAMVTSVPEPTSALMLGVGVTGLLLWRRRKRS